MIKILSA